LLSAHITPQLVTAAWGHQYQFYDVRVWSVLRVRALADISPVVRTVKYQTCRFRNLDLSVSMVQPAKDRMRAERSVLCLKSALRLERRDQQGQEEA
jgi:hypothetical protein